MHHPSNPPKLYAFPTKDVLIASLAEFIVKAQKGAINKKGRFTIALSGGSLPNMLRGLIGNKDVKWGVWYCKQTLQPKPSH
jgi:6-phosphogluconolactonase